MPKLPTLKEWYGDNVPTRPPPFLPDGCVTLVETFDLVWRALYNRPQPERIGPFNTPIPSPTARLAELKAIIRNSDGRSRETPKAIIKMLARHRRRGEMWFGRSIAEWEMLDPEGPTYGELYERDRRIHSAVQQALYAGSLPVTVYNDERGQERVVPSAYWGSSEAMIPCLNVTVDAGDGRFTGRVWVLRRDVGVLIERLRKVGDVQPDALRLPQRSEPRRDRPPSSGLFEGPDAGLSMRGPTAREAKKAAKQDEYEGWHSCAEELTEQNPKWTKARIAKEVAKKYGRNPETVKRRLRALHSGKT